MNSINDILSQPALKTVVRKAATLVNATVGVGSTTGTWQLIIRYESLGGDVEVA